MDEKTDSQGLIFSYHLHILFTRKKNHQVHPTPKSVNTTRQKSDIILEICLFSLLSDSPCLFCLLLLVTFEPNTLSYEFYHYIHMSRTKLKGVHYQDSSSTLWFLEHLLLRSPALHYVTISVIYLQWTMTKPFSTQKPFMEIIFITCCRKHKHYTGLKGPLSKFFISTFALALLPSYTMHASLVPFSLSLFQAQSFGTSCAFTDVVPLHTWSKQPPRHTDSSYNEYKTHFEKSQNYQ